jgi:hypothetical protein
MSPVALRRLAWIVFAVALLLWAADVVFSELTTSLQSKGSWDNNSVWAGLTFEAALLAFPVAGVLIATRRPRAPIGWLLLAIGVGWGLANLTYSDYGLRLHPGSLPAADYAGVISSVMWAPTIGITGTFLLLLFPDGHLPGRRWRYVGYASAFGILVGTVSMLVTPGPMADAGYPHTDNPLGISALHAVVGVGQATLILIPVGMVAAAASLIVRFRRASAIERQQIKWLAAAAAGVAAIYLVVMPLSVIVTPSSKAGPAWLQVSQMVALISFGLIPVAIGIAVLRHGLYAIDVIVRKTLVYTALIACLALLYIAGVYASQTVVRTISGQSGTLAVTISTLAVALAFQPLRRRIQRTVDRRFYRARYDAGRTLETFTSRMRDQVDLEALSGEMLEVVQGALHPSHATLWLRSNGSER